MPRIPTDFFAVLEARRSVRAFRPEPVSDELLEPVLEAMRGAPTAGNLQAFAVVVVRDPARRRALAAAAVGQAFVAQAPLVLVVLADPARSATRYRQRGEQLYALQDATIATAYAQLAAQARGIASVWVGAFDDEAVRVIVRAPEPMRPVALLVLGFPDESPPARPRRPLADLVHTEVVGGDDRR